VAFSSADAAFWFAYRFDECVLLEKKPGIVASASEPARDNAPFEVTWIFRGAAAKGQVIISGNEMDGHELFDLQTLLDNCGEREWLFKADAWAALPNILQTNFGEEESIKSKAYDIPARRWKPV
jgi:hypothetical protein